MKSQWPATFSSAHEVIFPIVFSVLPVFFNLQVRVERHLRTFYSGEEDPNSKKPVPTWPDSKKKAYEWARMFINRLEQILPWNEETMNLFWRANFIHPHFKGSVLQQKSRSDYDDAIQKLVQDHPSTQAFRDQTQAQIDDPMMDPTEEYLNEQNAQVRLIFDQNSTDFDYSCINQFQTCTNLMKFLFLHDFDKH